MKTYKTRILTSSNRDNLQKELDKYLSKNWTVLNYTIHRVEPGLITNGKTIHSFLIGISFDFETEGCPVCKLKYGQTYTPAYCHSTCPFHEK